MRKSLLLKALCITGTMMLTSCDQIKDFLGEEGDGEGGGTSEKVDLNYGLDANFTFEGSFKNSVANGITITNSNDISFVEGTRKETKGIKFNREKKSQLNISKALIGGEEWTISFWGKDLYDGSIFHAETASGSQLMSLSVDNGKLRFAGSTSQNNYGDFFETEVYNHATINDGQWHHIILTAGTDTLDNKAKVKLYIDNQYADQSIYYTSRYDNGIQLIFGGEMRHSVNTTNMSIDNLRVYSSRIINKKEIAALYDKDKPNYIAEVPSYVVPQSLYTYYTFENNLNDITENKINGFFNGSATYVPGLQNEGYALKLNNQDNNKMIITNPLIDTRKWSVSFWCKDMTDGHIFSIPTQLSGIMISLACVDGALKLVGTSYTNAHQYDNINSFFTPNLNDGLWHHIVINCDKTETLMKKTLYVDGIQTGILTQTNDDETGIQFVLGGSCEDPELEAASFTIDNLRIYDTRLLSDEEIQALYQAGE